MQYSAVAVLALAATASATYKNETVSYTTEIVTDYVTYCPAATTLTYGSVTYTASETVTIPGTYTVVKPVTTSSAVYCNTCAPTYTPVYPTANAPMALSGASLAGLLGLAAFLL
ncbi:hypothetical protein DL98DRAFT_298682 [Cadophora sp. DSE1049]|nr:hypothetical protein DL98DRAFT_298682 [Cadophora sp. DSE1049]